MIDYPCARSRPVKSLLLLATLLHAVTVTSLVMAGEPPKATAVSADSDTQTSGQPLLSLSKGKVERAQFTRAIHDREPVDDVALLTNDNDEIFFFTELKDYTGHTVTHRWEYQGEVIAEVKFEVKGPRWRVHSSKKINPRWTGVWSVVILADNRPVQIVSFEVVEKTP